MLSKDFYCGVLSPTNILEFLSTRPQMYNMHFPHLFCGCVYYVSDCQWLITYLVVVNK